MRALLILILLTAFQIILPTSVSSHFVKSDSGIGAVLHVDPGDDPVAGEQSNIILEFKDTNNKFTLGNCDCEIMILKGSEEILNQKLPPVAPGQDLSSVTPVIFPEKNIYKLKITGSSPTDLYPDFEINYDIRVEKEKPAGSVTATDESSWWRDHIIHLVGGAVIGILLIVALFAQNKKKVAIIILVMLLLAHSVPVKAIHASHDGPVPVHEFACCLPAPATIPVVTTLPDAPEVVTQINKLDPPILKLLTTHLQLIRPPPFF